MADTQLAQSARTAAQRVQTSIESAAVLSPDALLDMFGRVRGDIEQVVQSSPQDWSASQRRTVLAGFDRLIDALQVQRATVLVAARDGNDWQGTGARSLSEWRARESRVGKAAGRAEVAVAETLAEVPDVGAAVQQGSVTMEHAKIIARTRQQAPELCQQRFARDGATELLELAKKQDAAEFAKSAQRWVATHDPVGFDATHEDRRRARYFHLTETPEAVFLKGQLDPVAGRTLRIALEAATARPGVDDLRTASQRQADALVTLAQGSLDAGERKNGALVRPHVTIVMSEHTFAAARRRKAVSDRAVNDLGGASVQPGAVNDEFAGESAAAENVIASEPAEFEDGTPVPLTEIDRLLCDCELTRVVMDADSVPVDLGRTQRLYSREQRRAVIARDRHCQFDQCAQPARWCEVHHIKWWKRDGGVTSIDNAILLCSFHHHEVHRRNLALPSQAPPGRYSPARALAGGRQISGGRGLTGGPEDCDGRAVSGRPALANGQALTGRRANAGTLARQDRTLFDLETSHSPPKPVSSRRRKGSTGLADSDSSHSSIGLPGVADQWGAPGAQGSVGPSARLTSAANVIGGPHE